MKKILAMLLCLLMLASTLAGCAQKNDREEKGAVIPVYLSSQIFSFDPATAYTDDAAAMILSMLYEGLFKLDVNGKVVKGMCSGYKDRSKPEDNYYMYEFYLEETGWSDGRTVQAADFVYAFKRIMEPEFRGEGCAMLYGLKNARAVKAGDMSIDDLGVYAAGERVLQLEFEEAPDLDILLQYLASPLLVPLREDAISKVPDWSSNPSVLVTNGQFVVRTFAVNMSLVLERNIYYRRDVEEDSLYKYVVPYRLAVNFHLNEDENLAYFTDDAKLAYNSNLPLAKRAEYADKVTLKDTQNVIGFVFNTENSLFSKAEVRRALSIALDRQAIADLIVYATPATGLITKGVFEDGAKKKTQFREVGGDLIAASANVTEAKNLLSKAGVSKGSFTISIRSSEVDRAVAAYAASVWEQLGFKVTIKELSAKKYSTNDYDLVEDTYTTAYEASDFDVIIKDTQMLSTDAFVNLAQYAVSFAGGKLDLLSGNYDLVPHVSGYDSKDYDALIEQAFAEKDHAKRAELLHQAEAKLIEDAPIAPLAVYQTAALVGDDVTKLAFGFDGYPDFDAVRLKNEDYYLDTIALLTESLKKSGGSEETLAETTPEPAEE